MCLKVNIMKSQGFINEVDFLVNVLIHGFFLNWTSNGQEQVCICQ